MVTYYGSIQKKHQLNKHKVSLRESIVDLGKRFVSLHNRGHVFSSDEGSSHGTPQKKRKTKRDLLVYVGQGLKPVKHFNSVG